MVTTTTTTENHKIVVMEHELVVGWRELVREKTIDHSDIGRSLRVTQEHFWSTQEPSATGPTKSERLKWTGSRRTLQLTRRCLTRRFSSSKPTGWDLWCPTISDEQIANNQAAESQNPLPVAKQVENEEEPQLPVEVPDLPVEDDDDEDEAPENEVPDAVPEDFQQPTTTEFPAESIPNDPKAEFWIWPLFFSKSNNYKWFRL